MRLAAACLLLLAARPAGAEEVGRVGVDWVGNDIVVEAIADHLRFKRLEGFPDAAWVGISNEPVVSSEALEQHRVFTSVLSVTYRERR